jgi:cytochrome c553
MTRDPILPPNPSSPKDKIMRVRRDRKARAPNAFKRFVLAVAVAGLGTAQIAWAQPPASEQATAPESQFAANATAFFETNIRPVLIEQCIRCHGPDKAESGLRLDSAEGLARGGDSGSAIDRESPKESLILQAIRYEGLEMPPSKPLSEHQIASMEAWIETGAAWPSYPGNTIEATVGRTITDEERAYWQYRPWQTASPPASSFTHPIDAFVDAQLQSMQLSIAEPAPEPVLVRRLYLDLVGMPPTPNELQSYLDDPADNRYEHLVDRLLEDPRYGERWGRFWLDLVRYAESDGFKQDAFRTTAYRYRDYVVHALQHDKPYGQFLAEQIAGDEIDPDSDELNAATGYLRHWTYEYNQRDVRSQWDNILNDLTDVTGEAILGMSLACARCHDHKFDPILQQDYYRLQSFFAALEPRYDVPADRQRHQNWLQDKQAWEERSAPVKSAMQTLEEEIRSQTIQANIEKFPPDVRPALRKPAGERSPEERPIAILAYLQIQNDLSGIDFSKRLQGESLERWKELKSQLDELKKEAPAAPELALTVRDSGPQAPRVQVPGKPNSAPIDPQVPSVVEGIGPLEFPQLPNSTGRRLALARWLGSPENPLPWRVLANRIWQQHFGRGLVANASDLGHLSEHPTHPELLEYLAHYLVDHGGGWKPLHRLIATSATYRQSSYPAQRSQGHALDPSNRWLWRHSMTRMDAEQIRDAILLVTGTLDQRSGGPSDPKDSNRRSIYQRVMRNSLHPMLSMFDAPDGSSSVGKRNVTTTPLQSLYITNAAWPMQKAAALVERLAREHNLHPAATDTDKTETGERDTSAEDQVMIQALYQTILLRAAEPRERDVIAAFLEAPTGSVANLTAETAPKEATPKEAAPNDALSRWVDVCHALLCSNEFLYVE